MIWVCAYFKIHSRTHITSTRTCSIYINHIFNAIYRILLVFVPMLLLTLLIPRAFGGGDIKLMAASGFFLGMRLILCAMILAIIAGSIYGIIMLKNRKRDRKDQFAFGPFLAIGLSIAAFLGNEIVSWYLKIQH